jgi:hypothetical protein
MAINNTYFDINEVIEYEYVDVVRKNPRDMSKKRYISTKDQYNTIKWCRRNFGDRGDGWDFYRNGKEITVEIWSSRLVTMWEMWQN